MPPPQNRPGILLLCRFLFRAAIVTPFVPGRALSSVGAVEGEMRKGAGRRCGLPLRSRTLAHLEPSPPMTMWYAPGTGALGQSSVWRDKTPRRER